MAQTALISVSDKTGILEFAQALHALGIKLLSTGGTASTMAIGSTAPTANDAADASAAWTGRARSASVMPNSSRAWLASASCAVSSVATWSASSALRPRFT